VHQPQAEAASIDEQLTELLSDGLEAMHVTDRKAGEVVTPQGAAAPQDFGRDGVDPFKFDLGPSPFAPRSKPETTVEEPENFAPAAASKQFETSEEPAPIPHVEEPYSEDPYGESKPQTNGAPAGSALVPTSSISSPVLMDIDAPLPPEPSPASRLRPSFAVPSVSATLGPSRNLEPLSDSFQTPAPEVVSRDRSQGRILPPAASTLLTDYFGSASRVEARQEPVDRVLQPTATPPALPEETNAERSMEDAVADLLRPLLKTWLAENMPKIVERALRREMSERLLPGQKNTLD
jgi:cell pole-organizing protein PopZ